MRFTHDPESNTLTFPEVPGVDYLVDNKPVTGVVEIKKTTTVTAEPREGFRFPKGVQRNWTFEVNDKK